MRPIAFIWAAGILAGADHAVLQKDRAFSQTEITIHVGDTVTFKNTDEFVHNVFSSTQWTGDVNWPGAKEFNERYKARFGKEPTYHASTAYSSMIIMAETAAKAKGNSDRTRDLLKRGKWNGIMGEVRFADYLGYTNQNKHQMLVEQIQKGVHQTVYPPQYVSKKAVYPFPGWSK